MYSNYSKLNKSFYFRLVLILIFIISTGFQNFGLGFYWFSIPFPFIKITEGLMIFIFLFVYSIISEVKIKWTDSVLLPVILLILFTIFHAIYGMQSGMVLSDLAQKAPIFICLFFIIPLMYQIRTIKGLNIFIKSIVLIGFIGAILTIIQLFVPNLFGQKILESEGLLRVGNPAILLTSYSAFYTFSSILSKNFIFRKNLIYTIFIVSIIAIFLTYARGLIFAELFGFLIIIFMNRKSKRIAEKIRIFVFIIVSIFTLFSILKILNYNVDAFIKRTLLGIEQVQSKSYEGSIGYRKEMTHVKMETILEESPIIGIGLKFKDFKNVNISSSDYKAYYTDPNALNGDSTWPDVIIIYGILGILIFLYSFISIYRNAYKIVKYSNSPFIYPIALSIVPVPFFILIHSFASSYISSAGFIYFVTIVFILYLLKQFTFRSYN